ncbi:MAG: HEAT repeat domain-containing protein [Gemmataceae bacterium]
MLRFTSRLSFLFAGLLLAAPLFAQRADDPYRRFYKQPETPQEFWSAVKFEIDLGKYDLARQHLEGFVKSLPEGEEGDKILLEMEQKDGIATFLQLLSIPDIYTITEAKLGMWQEKMALPRQALESLALLKNNPIAGKDKFLYELSKVMDPPDYRKYRDFLADETRTSMRPTAGPLIERVSSVVKKFRADPERIRKFIKNLDKTPEERAYAITELKKSGALAVPYMIEALQKHLHDSAEQGAIVYALTQLNREAVPPILAALDIDDATLRAYLVDVLRQRRDMRAVPHLWYLAGSPKQPAIVRKFATNALAELLNENPRYLPNAVRELTKEANRFYEHKVELPAKVEVWEWDSQNKTLKSPPAEYTPSQAEEYFGLRFARQALDIDPTNIDAQVAFLSLALDKAYERAGVDQPLEKFPADIRNLMRTVNYELMMATLDRALHDKRLPVILASTRALGDLVDVRSIRPSEAKAPVLMRALNYPDRRVQLSAANAILTVPGGPFPAAGPRLVEVLRRSATIGAMPKILIGDMDKDRSAQVGQGAREAGYAFDIAATGRDLMRRFRDAGDVDAIFLDENLANPMLPYLLAQLRADLDAGMVPVFVTAAVNEKGEIPLEREQRLKTLIRPYKNVYLMPTTVDANQIKQRVESRTIDSFGKPLVGEERQAHATLGMLWLKRMATGEVTGYDVLPAESAIRDGLHNELLLPLALEAAANLPGREPQRDLATIVLDPKLPADARSYAALMLIRNIQKNGVLITDMQVAGLHQLFAKGEDARLKANVALVLGALKPTAGRTGQRLTDYLPPDPAAPKPMPMEKEKEKDN